MCRYLLFRVSEAVVVAVVVVVVVVASSFAVDGISSVVRQYY